MATTKQVLIFKQGIEEYTGRAVTSIETYTDSIGAIAMRACFLFEEQGEFNELDFLIANYDVKKCIDAKSTVSWLEETEYEIWPPKEGSPRFL